MTCLKWLKNLVLYLKKCITTFSQQNWCIKPSEKSNIMKKNISSKGDNYVELLILGKRIASPFAKKCCLGATFFVKIQFFLPQTQLQCLARPFISNPMQKVDLKNKKSPNLWKKSPLSGFELGTLGWLILTVTSLSNFSNLQKLTLPPFSVSYVAPRKARHLKPSLKHPRDLPLCLCQVWGRSNQRFRRL